MKKVAALCLVIAMFFCTAIVPIEKAEASAFGLDGLLSMFGNTKSGLRPEFKKAMDEYEAFYDMYIEVLSKNNASVTKLSELLVKEKEAIEAFEAWEDDMNDAEMVYYMEVQLRVLQKLTAVTK